MMLPMELGYSLTKVRCLLSPSKFHHVPHALSHVAAVPTLGLNREYSRGFVG